MRQPKVTILMGVFRGAKYLPIQLDSIGSQTHENWQLVCSDDGSDDGSIGILHEFASGHSGKVRIVAGPGRGFSRNYMSMLAALGDDPGYVCLADQDDFWFPEKLSHSLNTLKALGDHPALYCGRHLIWDTDRDTCLPSPKRLRPCTLRNALIENVASGNTVMINPAAATLARRAAGRTGAVFAHDWWLYLLITGCGGQVWFDNGPPMLRYRQHEGNTIGAAHGIAKQVKRKIGVLRGLFGERLRNNIAALTAVDDLLTDEARHLVTDFARAQRAHTLERLLALHGLRPYRQHWLGTLGFWGAASLGRI